MNQKTENVLIAVLVIGAIATVTSTTQVSAYAYRGNKPAWTQHDLDGEGTPDFQYHVTEHEVEARDAYFITVAYKDLDCNYLGEEV